MDVYNRYCNPAGSDNANASVACATTGKAAVALGGITVHAAFRLTINRDGGLRDNELNTFRYALRNVRCVIIDEVSMMSTDILQRVDSRLRIITCKYLEPFGGLDIILCGDLRQLLPVRAAEVFERVKTNSVFNTEIAWHHLLYFVLTKVVRQSDLRFYTILTKIRNGAEFDSEEIALIESRLVTQQQAETCCPGGIRLYYSNKESDYYNTNTAIATEDNSVAYAARDTIVGFRSMKEKTEAMRKAETLPKAELGNLPANIMLCIGKPYMLTLNVDVSDGLVNGSVGILQYIQYDTLQEPERIWLHFDINGLYLTNVDNDFTFYHGKPNPDRALLDEFRRLQSHKLQTVTAKCYAMIEQPHLFSVAALNVRSLPAHSKDVHHDPILRHASVLCLSETWIDPKQAVEIMNYQYCCGVSREHNRAAGVTIYVRKDHKASFITVKD
ncbi:ATP-dependent DNA helicase PIF1-like [Ixodes scapularis]|uniref:ATP-dependent DNA helicase PIF1-like n=1 Tax=Ixodes scapularis TaxID=6945 RepID=UPI001C3888E2|nr:ATP-dependent DNA helicase PIF1-like [Ixodes scapularis]